MPDVITATTCVQASRSSNQQNCVEHRRRYRAVIHAVDTNGNEHKAYMIKLR